MVTAVGFEPTPFRQLGDQRQRYDGGKQSHCWTGNSVQIQAIRLITLLEHETGGNSNSLG